MTETSTAQLEEKELEVKKELAKKGLYISAGATIATAFFTKNDFFRNLNMVCATSTIGFSVWNYMLNNPEKFTNKKNYPSKEVLNSLQSDKLAINLNNFYIELSIKGVLTKDEFKAFEEKIEGLLALYYIPKMNILLDIREIDGIELKSLWTDFLFAIRHFKEVKKISVVGNSKFEKYTIGLMDKLTSKEFHFSKNYEDAHKWLIS